MPAAERVTSTHTTAATARSEEGGSHPPDEGDADFSANRTRGGHNR